MTEQEVIDCISRLRCGAALNTLGVSVVVERKHDRSFIRVDILRHDRVSNALEPGGLWKPLNAESFESERDVFRYCHEMISRVLLHEVDEGLSVDGVPVFEAHEFDGLDDAGVSHFLRYEIDRLRTASKSCAVEMERAYGIEAGRVVRRLFGLSDPQPGDDPPPHV